MLSGDLALSFTLFQISSILVICSTFQTCKKPRLSKFIFWGKKLKSKEFLCFLSSNLLLNNNLCQLISFLGKSNKLILQIEAFCSKIKKSYINLRFFTFLPDCMTNRANLKRFGSLLKPFHSPYSVGDVHFSKLERLVSVQCSVWAEP